MAGKSDTFENDLLRHIFNNVAISLVGDSAGLPPAATAGSLYVALHTADPSEAGFQNTSEANYTGYARVAVPRSTAGWSVSGSSASPAADISFPAATAGSSTITHFSIGTSATGTGKVLYFGAVTPTVTVTAGITPQLTTQTTITED